MSAKTRPAKPFCPRRGRFSLSIKFSEGESTHGICEARRAVYLGLTKGPQKPMILDCLRWVQSSFQGLYPAEYLNGKIVWILIEKDTKQLLIRTFIAFFFYWKFEIKNMSAVINYSKWICKRCTRVPIISLNNHIKLVVLASSVIHISTHVIKPIL